LANFATKSPGLSEDGPSTWKPRALKSGAGWLASATQAQVDEFLAGLDENAFLALPWLFEFWALPHQLPPDGAWKTWVIMGGRGAGKTRAGAEWVRAEVEGATPEAPGRSRRVALMGETVEEVIKVMIEGESGILACTPPDRKPKWNASKKELTWANGAVAQVISAHNPERLRGPQFDAAWVDELAKWPKAEEAWAQLQFALRLGANPRQVVTTTPRNVDILKSILNNPSTVLTHAPTAANAAYLAETFLEEVNRRYGGTSLGRQELDGEIVEDLDGTLWSNGLIEAAKRVEQPKQFSRIVVAVDPSVSGGKDGDACGIVVVGAMTEGPVQDWRAVVLEDATVQGVGPDVWARAAVAAVDRWQADRLVAEANQGGKLVESVIRTVDSLVPLKLVHASDGKSTRAEPVAALYEQGRVAHVAGLSALEGQMRRMTKAGFMGRGSPDRVDALVWAMTELILEPSRQRRAEPMVRSLI
jgi:phage terminase large subunit-like protein